MSNQIELRHDGRTQLRADGGQLTTFRVNHHDTGPALDATLHEPTGEPLDLTDALRVEFVMWPDGHTRDAATVESSAEIVNDPTDGHVRYNWGRSDLTESGIHRAVFVVHFPDRGRLSIPNTSSLTVIVS